MTDDGPASDSQHDRIHFLNVDLDLHAPDGLDAIVAAFDGVAMDLHDGDYPRPLGDDHASFEVIHIDHETATPESTIAAFCDAIESFPADAKQQWTAASERVFNIGIECGSEPYHQIWRLPAELVKRVAALGGVIELTVYRSSEDSPSSCSR